MAKKSFIVQVLDDFVKKMYAYQMSIWLKNVFLKKVKKVLKASIENNFKISKGLFSGATTFAQSQTSEWQFAKIVGS